LTADVALDGLLLNGRLFQLPAQPSEYSAVLQTAARVVEPAPLAPFGHRNNQIHLFDELGLYLIEHHATRLVDAVVFVLWLEESAFKPVREYSGQLTIGSVPFFPGMTPRDYSGGTIVFEGPILGHWNARRDGIYIGLDAKGMREPSGRRGKRLRFVDVSICFSARQGARRQTSSRS
jgi:hypothetical protein